VKKPIKETATEEPIVFSKAKEKEYDPSEDMPYKLEHFDVYNK